MATKKVKTKKSSSSRESRDSGDDEFPGLPTKLSEIVTELARYSLYIYGLPKIGKTGMVSKFPKVVQGMTERGYKALRINDYPLHALEWPAYLNFGELVAESTSFENVSLDVLGVAYEKCFKFMKEDLGITGDPQWGEWNDCRDPFINLCLKLANLPDKGCIFVSHAKHHERTGSDGETFEGIMPDLNDKASIAIEGAVDLIGFIGFKNGKRVMQILGDDNVIAGNRICTDGVGFTDTEGKAVKYIPLGDSNSEAYENFVRAFENQQSPKHLHHVFPPKKESDKPPLKKKKTV